MVNDGKENLDVYKFDTSDKIDKKKIFLAVFILLSAIFLILIIINIANTVRNYHVYKKYEEQLIALNQKEAEKKEEEEAKKEAERQAKLPKLTEEGKQNMTQIYHSDTKRAFLTFDDGPSAVTGQILDVLKSENVKATFFVLGSKVEHNPGLIKRMYDEGHYIANHGYSHVYSEIYSSQEAVLAEYNMCNEAVKNALGEPEYNSHLFRFPGGLAGGKYAEVKKQAEELLSQNNIVHIDWNALSGDAETNKLTPEFELSRLNNTVGNKNSVVILMHDSPAKKTTADTLPQIIHLLRDKGFEFKNFYEIIK